MKNTNDNVKKICNFYMSDWHFTVMLLPYINKEINKGTKVITFFEKNMTEKVKTLVEKLNLKNKDKILQINWENTSISSFMNYLESELKENVENLLIINGNNHYINEANNIIDMVINKKEVLNTEIKVIDCYDFDSNKENMNDILKKHDGILNTSGESKVEYVL